MDMQYVTGRSFSSITSGFKEDDGNWRVLVEMSETLVYPNGTSRKEVIEGTATESDFHAAHKGAMQKVLQELQDLVYSRGFDSLIEAVDYQRNLEEGDDSNKADEATASE